MGFFDRKPPPVERVNTTVRDPNALPRPARKAAKSSRDARYSRGTHSAQGYRARGRRRAGQRAGRIALMALAVVVLAAITFALLSCLT